ncbi:hypothetical protein Holit_00889 [Hollandina sp. SP2]
MYGGTIRDNSVKLYDGQRPNGDELIHYATSGPASGSGSSGLRKNGTFVKEGGSITGNTDEREEPCNAVIFNETIVTIEEGVSYSMPPLPPASAE